MQSVPNDAAGMRPELHFTARSGWINDPHTLVHHDGRYHLFFQYVPDSTVWQPSCHWGHATSIDLLRWEERAPALSPGDGDDGCWSGSMATGAIPTLFYTSVTEPDRSLGSVRTATPEDAAWEKWTKGPVVVAPPLEPTVSFFRDPYLRREGSGWRMVVGAALADGSAAAFGYRSEDLDTWSSDGVLTSRASSDTTGVETGTGWECPALVRVDDHDVLLVSVWDSHVLHYEAYRVGSVSDGRFEGGPWRRMTYGPSYYAGAAFTDAQGQPCLIHWLREVADPGAGWAGAHSLPHLLRVEGDRLLARPHDVVDSLRRDMSGAEMEGEGGSRSVSVGLPADIEWTPGPSGGRLAMEGSVIELSASSRVLSVAIADFTCEVEWKPAETVRIIVDGPAVEIFTRAGVISAGLPASVRSARLDMTGAGSLRTWRVPAPIG